MTEQNRFNPALFKFSTEVAVRNYEVDWQGILHNAVYLLYFEISRVAYLKNLGATFDLNSVRGANKVVLVRNEIDYRSPVTFDEVLRVHTRISGIKNSSFVMEGLMEQASTGKVVSTNVAFHVWLDPTTNRSKTVPDDFRKLVQDHEGSDCAIHWPTRDV